MWAYIYAMVCLWRLGNNYWKWVLSLLHVCPGNQTVFVRVILIILSHKLFEAYENCVLYPSMGQTGKIAMWMVTVVA